ncbi:hypothetical protein GCM10012289_01060 [Nonomuraea cavernae]|uniref:Uncharacterized protein n=1 Tax=Nonomuraea cavernae TaxID=2045107 RepID=A0A918DE98_9ACTN|nr:hypothetical protein GCM10012289_01060 [Nonomuraea cavernae]
MPVAHPRLHLIVGLHALAGFLEARPDIPTPDRVIVHHFIPRADDTDMRTELEHLAALLGTPVDSDGGQPAAPSRAASAATPTCPPAWSSPSMLSFGTLWSAPYERRSSLVTSQSSSKSRCPSTRSIAA